MRLGNIATLSREWAAIKRVEVSPIREILLQGNAIGLCMTSPDDHGQN